MARTDSGQPVPPRLPDSLSTADEAVLEDDLMWSEVEVKGDFVGQSADDVEIVASRLTGARLTGVTIGRLRMVDTIVDSCDLSGAVLRQASLTRVALRDCRMSGSDLSLAKLRDVAFVGCKLDDANLRMVTGERVRFDGTVLRSADLYEARLVSARFFDCDLTATQLTKADLGAARLHGSTIDAVVGAEHLRGVVIDSAQVLPLALRLFASFGIAVDDDRE